jgi:hypothetical protein
MMYVVRAAHFDNCAADYFRQVRSESGSDVLELGILGANLLPPLLFNKTLSHLLR